MGDGTSSGVQTPPQPGVVVREGENFPLIPEKLLRLSPEQLQAGIDKLAKRLEFNRHVSVISDPKLDEKLEMTQAVYEFAKTAVERQLAARRGKER